MQKVALFFDGRNFFNGYVEHAAGWLVDFHRLSTWLVERVAGDRLWGAQYYTGVDDGTDFNVESQRRLSNFLDRLELVPGFFVYRFPRSSRTLRCNDCGAEHRIPVEKQVDTTMVADMLRVAAVGSVDIFVLVSGDADLAPAVEGVRALGRQVYVASWAGSGLSMRLRRVAFDHIDLLSGLSHFATPKVPLSERAEVEAAPLSQGDIFYGELQRAESRFGTTGFVGLRYFVNRWKSDALPPLPDLRMKILDQLVSVGAVEVYDAPNGDQALRTLPGFLDRPEDEPEAADED
jgi:uncharacterized LabA/DUF88 family protein